MQPSRNILNLLLILFTAVQNEIANALQGSETDFKNFVANGSQIEKGNAETAESLIPFGIYNLTPSRVNLNKVPSAYKAAIASTYVVSNVPLVTATDGAGKIKPQEININSQTLLKVPEFLQRKPVSWALAKDSKFYNNFGTNTRYFQPLRTIEPISSVNTETPYKLSTKDFPAPTSANKILSPQVIKILPYASKTAFVQSTIKSGQTTTETNIPRFYSLTDRETPLYNSNVNAAVGVKNVFASIDERPDQIPRTLNAKLRLNTIKPILSDPAVLTFNSRALGATGLNESVVPLVPRVFNYAHSGKNGPPDQEKQFGATSKSNLKSGPAKSKTFINRDDDHELRPRLRVPQENEIRLVVNLTPHSGSSNLLSYLPSLKSLHNERPKIIEVEKNKPSVNGFLSVLKETSKLPKNLTPDNIENGIKTLAFILEKLQKEKQPVNVQTTFTPIVSVDGKEKKVSAGLKAGTFKELETFPRESGSSTPGKPGIDYPIYSSIPQTDFDCSTQRYKGFFGDPETKCQVWHYCDLNGGQASFLCPNGTIFSQVALTCDWWFNVKCASTSQLYVLNERLYKYILPFSPSFPEDFSGPVVDRYLAAKFKEMERKSKIKALKLSTSITSTPSPQTTLKLLTKE